MKNKYLILVCCIALAIFITACAETQVQVTQPTPAAEVEVETEQVAVKVTPEEVEVDVKVTEKGSSVKEIDVTARQWEFSPNPIEVNKGDTVRLKIKSLDVTHGFALPTFGVSEQLQPGREVVVEFVADKEGSFSFLCTVPCGQGHSNMRGTLVVS